MVFIYLSIEKNNIIWLKLKQVRKIRRIYRDGYFSSVGKKDQSNDKFSKIKFKINELKYLFKYLN